MNTQQGMFGMNVDILANNPPIKWYFIIAIPFTALVLILAVLIRGRHWIKSKVIPKKSRTRSSEEGINVGNNGAGWRKSRSELIGISFDLAQLKEGLAFRMLEREVIWRIVLKTTSHFSSSWLTVLKDYLCKATWNLGDAYFFRKLVESTTPGEESILLNVSGEESGLSHK
jgi:hypothetical protein